MNNDYRVVSRQVSRRQALTLLTGAIGSVTLSSHVNAAARAVPKRYAAATLSLPIKQMQMENTSVLNIIQKLQGGCQVPISFIQTLDEKLTTIDVVNGTSRDVLMQIIQQNPAYDLRVVGGRAILMPTNWRYDMRVDGIVIVDTARQQAANDYFHALQSRSAKFKDMGFALFVVGIGIHWPQDTVTLSRKGTVLTHFVEMLALDETLFFSLHKYGLQDVEGHYLFWFGNVGTSPLAQSSNN